MNWIVVLVILVAIVAWMAWIYFSFRRTAKLVDNTESENTIHINQLVDVREAGVFKTKHIMRARDLPASQTQFSMSAIRRDKSVLLYDSSGSPALPRVIRTLKEAGYTNLYILKDGPDYWAGKVKES